jgi:hypothetical protein
LRHVLVSLVIGATAGALLLIHAPIYAPVLPLVVTVGVVAIAARIFRDRHPDMISAGVVVRRRRGAIGIAIVAALSVPMLPPMIAPNRTETIATRSTRRRYDFLCGSRPALMNAVQQAGRG